MVHNKWLQQLDTKMTCLYEATLDVLICAFMLIANYMSWLKWGSTGKDHGSVCLKLKVATKCKSKAIGRGHKALLKGIRSKH